MTRRWRVALLLIGVTACAERAPAVVARDASVGDARPSVGTSTGAPGLSGGSTRPGARGDACRARWLVLFDRSRSMEAPWTSADGTTAPRYRVAAEAVEAAVSTLADRLEVGAVLFPSREGSGRGACDAVDPIESQFPYQPGTSFLGAWAARWASADLLGSTPLDAAFDSADAALSAAGPGTAVVLLTDGEPTCTGATPAAVRAAAWRARGIETWVLGLPGSAPGRAWLDAVAEAGGTGSARSVDDAAGLAADLARIVGRAVEQACPP